MIQPDFEDESLLPKKPRSMTRMTRNRDHSKGTQKSGDGFTRQTLDLLRELDGFELVALAGLVLQYFILFLTGADGNLRYCLLLTSSVGMRGVRAAEYRKVDCVTKCIGRDPDGGCAECGIVNTDQQGLHGCCCSWESPCCEQF